MPLNVGEQVRTANWRREWDSNPRYGFPYTRFPSERLQPLGHPSKGKLSAIYRRGFELQPAQKGRYIRHFELETPPPRRGTFIPWHRYLAVRNEATQEEVMGRGLLLWLIGIPLPIILLIWVLGGLHG
jgi:hypothetical protein